MAPNPKHVTPDENFDPDAGQPLTLFEAGGYTVISGKLRDDQRARLFVRCEGHSPTIRGCPTGWHVIPEFLEMPLLYALLDEVDRNPKAQSVSVTDRRDLIFSEIKQRQRQSYK